MARIDSYQVHRLRVDTETEWVFLELRLDDGTTGLGEALLGGQEELLASALAIAARSLQGEEAAEAAPPVEVLADDQASGLLKATVRSAIDQCLWDLRGKLAALPVYAMTGPVLRTEFQLYANVNRGTRDRSPAGFALRAAQAKEDGFDAVKIAPFDDVGQVLLNTPRGRAAFELGLQRIVALRDAIGEDATLMVDCHCRLDLPAALRLLDATQAVRLDWLEDALPYHDKAAWKHLRAASQARLIGGETARGIRDVVPFLAAGLWDVVMPDVRFFGGISEMLALTPLALQYQIGYAPHNPRGPVGTLASAHAMASCPAFLMLEFQYGECDWRSGLAGGAERIEDGKLILSNAPGLGLELTLEAVPGG